MGINSVADFTLQTLHCGHYRNKFSAIQLSPRSIGDKEASLHFIKHFSWQRLSSPMIEITAVLKYI